MRQLLSTDHGSDKPLPALQPQISLFFVSLYLTDEYGITRPSSIPSLCRIIHWANSLTKTMKFGQNGEGRFPVVHTSTYVLPLHEILLICNNAMLLEQGPRSHLTAQLQHDLQQESRVPAGQVFLCIDGIDEHLVGANLHRKRLIRYLALGLSEVTLISGLDERGHIQLTRMPVPSSEECEHAYFSIDGILCDSRL